MKKITLLLLTFCLAWPALAQSGEATAVPLRLKDVPDDHWAASAVYDLVRLGVTKGYPDGTFRGNKPINRFETAIFLSKLAKSLGGEDIKGEIKALRDQIADLKKPQGEMAVAGTYQGDWKMGNILSSAGAPRTGLADYRLVVKTAKELGEGADLKINLDTMDYGYYDDGSAAIPGRGLLASELFDIESNLKLDLSDWNLKAPVHLKLTYGPGPKQHAFDPTGAFSSEVGVTYLRPDTGIEARTKLFGAEVTTGYYSLQNRTLDLSGRINTSWLTGAISYKFDRFLLVRDFKVDLTGDYVSRGLLSTSDRSIKAKIDLLAPLGEKAQAQTTVGLGKSSSQMMVAGSVSLNDPWETGTVMMVRAAKVGSAYIDGRFAGEQFDLAGYDNFDRPLENGTVNFGGQLVQSVSDKVKLIGKGDVRLNGDFKYEGSRARATGQGGISYNLAPNVNFDAAYRVYQDKLSGDTSDLAAVGLLYRF
ncbi:MAG: S-layer homology domain-containing protein [Candidatus Margulisiibacteriota bacterium]